MEELKTDTNKQPTPAAEFFCICLGAMAMPLVLMGFGVYRIIEMVTNVLCGNRDKRNGNS